MAVAEEGVLEEITVVARKREESLQSTPLSVSAFTSEQLQARQVGNLSQISEFTPNLTFDPTTPISGSNSAASIYIRGVGQFDFTLVSDPGVGIYVNGVYVARSVGSVLELLDAERVEVLRGPQGTLFGKNTIGGAINIISKKPESDFSGYGEIKVGTDERLDFKGSVNVPFADTFGARFSVADLNQNGYVENLGGGDALSDTNATVGVASFQWEPNERFNAALTWDGTRRREEGRAQKLLRFNPTSGVPSFGAFTPVAAFLGAPLFDDRYLAGGKFATNQSMNPRVKSDLDLWGLGFTMEYEIGRFTLRSITGYREFDSEFGRDTDNSPYTIVETFDSMDHEQVSQELQIQGDAFDARLNWIVGGFYFSEDGSNRNDVAIPVFTIVSGGSIDNDNWAIFGQGTYDLTEKLSLTFGARYTDETKRFTPEQFVAHNRFTVPVFGGAGIPDGTPILPAAEFSRDDDSFDISASIAYRWTEDLMTYVSYAEGFKGGGFDQRVFPPRGPDGRPAAFDPETVDMVEGGIKWENESRTLRINGAVFHSDYDDVQVRVLDALAPGIGNAASGEIFGAELEFLSIPTDRLTLSGGFAYLDTEITELGPNIDPAADRLSVGNRFINSPEWSVNASAAYRVPLRHSIDLTVQLDWSWRDKNFNNWANDGIIAQPSLHLLNASATFDLPGEGWAGGWRLVLAGRNLTDETYIVTGNEEFDSFGYTEVIYARPREWSLSLRKDF